jgi:hypothetical protein
LLDEGAVLDVDVRLEITCRWSERAVDGVALSASAVCRTMVSSRLIRSIIGTKA